MIHRIWPLVTLIVANYPALIVAIAAVCAVPRVSDAIQRFARFITRLFSRPIVCVVAAFVFSAAFNILWARFHGIPLPAIHDEFSYLLAGDTYAHGRLTNPTPDLWEHFETFHELFTPTYASKYPPGQGLFLAMGQVTLGLPIAGVWLASALACAATVWAAILWLGRRWAVLAMFVVVFNPRLLQWSQGYWGGSVAMLGGALALGAARGLMIRRKTSDALFLAVGFLVLANSRPWEGFGVALGLISVLGMSYLGWMGKAASGLTPRAILMAGIVLALGAAWMAYFNWRVTGKPLLMPYVLHERQYAAAPVLLIQEPVPMPHYRVPEIEEALRYGELGNYTEQRTPEGFFRGVVQRLSGLVDDFLFGSPLAVGFVWAVLLLPRNRRAGALIFVALLFLAAFLLVVWHFSHYASPGVAAMVIVMILGLRHLRAWQRRRARIGQTLFYAVMVTSVLCYLYGIVTAGGNDSNMAVPRQVIIDRLSEGSQRYLIFVKYLPGHSFGWEWVENGADIDGAKILWARDKGDAENRALLNRYTGRRAWMLQVGSTPGDLQAYAP